MKIFGRTLTGLALVLSLSALSAVAEPLQVMEQGDISYITGGVGEQEATNFESTKNQYQLRVLNADAKGAYVGENHFIIRDKSGNDLLSAEGGPLFYANLPNGNYSITTETGGKSQTKHFTISSGKPADLRFIWNTPQS